MTDPLWTKIITDAEAFAGREPTIAPILHRKVLERGGLEDAVTAIIAGKLEGHGLPLAQLEEALTEAFATNPRIGEQIRCDIEAIVERDPATDSPLQPLLFYKGFHALCTYRAAHHWWQEGRVLLAAFLQSMMSEAFAVDIHPAARIGCGILLDHATSFVVGETAVVEDHISILHEVTLGGTGKEHGDRHPIIRRGVLLGAGAKVLGRVTVGEGAKVGAGSVVLSDVAPHTTVAGVPAVPVGKTREDSPADWMDQGLGV